MTRRTAPTSRRSGAGPLAGLLLVVVSLLGSIPAAAQQSGQDAEAKALFQAGRVAYGEGRFDSALNYFRQAYNLSPRPALLYNIGSAADRLRRDAEALQAFEEYLAKVPDADNRAEVEARIRVLRSATAPPANAVPPTAVPGPAPPPAAEQPPPAAAPLPQPAPVASATAAAPPAATEPTPGPGSTAASGARDSSLAPWIVIGASGAALVTGGVLLALALGDISAVEGASDGTRWSEVRDAHDRAPTLSGIGIGLAAAGAAGVAVGAMWLGMNHGGAAELRVGLSPTSVQVGGSL